MSFEDTAKIMGVLEAAFPAFYRGQTESQRAATLRLWHMQFSGTAYGLVEAAVLRIISTQVESYPPTIASVNAAIRELETDEDQTGIEAWGLVRRAISNGLYGARQEWERLPKTIQKIVTPEQIRNWAGDDNFNESVVSSNFMRSYAVVAKQEKEIAMIPENVRGLIAETLNRMEVTRRNNRLLKELSPELAMLKGDTDVFNE